jgi:hypothetical protein
LICQEIIPGSSENFENQSKNVKGVLSVLAAATFTTRNNLVDSIERQLLRSYDIDLHVASAYLNVAQTRSLEAERRGLTVYGEKKYPKRMWNRCFTVSLRG